ncbi:hypothetical protein BDV25DRAFT_151192 [Aspergillus avenaceus]|uniref:Zn(2)-C6 fungal-type domain-containing protein n=1 Tax=Aspergillus avenaceus TaxID=36643 RepID=A0A5N6U281_ASPAV|nr:hypothetical protein BDV25DRAFT_151192 [Aspergillus avenaceus]
MGPHRSYSKRSRTGCQTCRIRHVKCDEAPGKCFNCTSTGRKCEGYDQNRLPLVIARAQKPNLEWSPTIRVAHLSSDERRGFAFFLGKTVPMMTRCFDSELWQRLVLQMSQAEPAICHAVIALSAVHERSWSKGARLQRLRDSYQHFALAQYNKAIAKLHVRLRSHDPQVHLVVLTCCMAFITLELLQGNITIAFSHLQQGLNILRSPGCDTGQVSETRPSSLEPPLAEAFMNMELTAGNFDLSDSGLKIQSTTRPLTVHSQQNCTSNTIWAAKQVIARIINDLMLFQSHCERAAHGHLKFDTLAMSVERCRIRRRLTDFSAAFEESIAGHYLSPSKMRSVDMIHLHETVLTNVIDTSLDKSEMVFDQYLSVFIEINMWVERIIDSLKDEYADDMLPHLITDLGIINPLIWVFLKCRHAETRLHGLRLLEAWPHREGPSDSIAFSSIGRAVHDIEMQAETVVEGPDGEATAEIPESGRVKLITHVDVLEDGRDGVMYYYLSGDRTLRHWQFSLKKLEP